MKRKIINGMPSKEYYRNYYANHKEQYAESIMTYRRTEKGKEVNRKAWKKFIKKNRIKGMSILEYGRKYRQMEKARAKRMCIFE